jgi:hypothetical protein
MSDYQTLVDVLQRFAEQSKSRPLSLGEALDTLDEAAYAYIAIILVLPFMQPIPTGPLSVIGGLAFAALGWQLLRGHKSLTLPKKVRALVMSENSWRMLVKVCLKILGFCRKFTKPRYTAWVSGRKGQQAGGFVLVAGGLLMAIPFGVLPFNNTLPGLAILFYGIGELEQDGLMVFVAFFWLVVSVIYFTLFFTMLWYFGNEALTILHLAP